MALSQDFLDELHERNDIVDVIQSVVPLRSAGRRYTGLCPFHNEKTPSFTVYPDTQSYYCFGCGAGGDVITFIKNYENLDYIEAVKALADRAGMRMPEDTDDTAARTKKRTLEANRAAARYFFDTLNSEEGKQARAYLRGRGLSDATIKRFGLGYAPAGWNGLRDALQAQGFSRKDLVTAGLCVEGKNNSCFDFFRDRVMFPIIDIRGNVVAFSGRTMGADTRKYVNSRESSVFVKSRTFFGLNIAKNAETHRVILVEGQMDVISLHQAGFTDAIATLGTAITSEHARILSRYVEEVLICYDSDEAGQKATRRAIDTLRTVGLPARVVQIEGAKDPDELIKNKGSSAFRAALDNASGSMEYELMRAKKGLNLETTDDRVAYLSKVGQILAGSRSITEREVWAGVVAKETGVDKATILESARRIENGRRRQERDKENRQLVNSITDRLNVPRSERSEVGGASAERRLIALLAKNPDFIKGVSRSLAAEDFSSAEAGKCFQVMQEQMQEGIFNGYTSMASRLSEQEMAVYASFLAEYTTPTAAEKDADYYVERILQNRNRMNEETLREMDPEEIAKRIQQKEKKAHE